MLLKRMIAFFSLFTSVSTLMCCAFPALFVVLGMGAAFAGLVGKFPQLIWISEHKTFVFGFGAAMLIIGGLLQWHSRKLSCPSDTNLAESCESTRDWSKWIYFCSLSLYAIGAVFAYGIG